MLDIDRRRYEMLVRVRDFGASFGHLLPRAATDQALGMLAAALQAIEAAHVAETSAFVSARAARKAAARRALSERLVLMQKAAGLLPGRRGEFRAHFDVPTRANDQVLLNAARQAVQQATPLAAEFIAHGMALTFPADIEALIEGFESALRERGMSRDEHVAARARIKGAMANGIRAVRTMDVIVGTHMARGSEARDVWAHSRRIEYPGRSKREAEASPALAEVPKAA
jgi:hypothetical protein